MQTFDFKNNSIQVLDLATLKATHKENDIYGNPLKGLYHYEVINRIANICRNSGLDYELEEIFAAQNRSRQTPSVVILPQVEAIHGENAVQAHILRRVYTTIKIHDLECEEMNTTIAIAYHQDGIQIGFGPNVKICHNQCILSPNRIVQNFGADKVSNEEMFESVRNWLNNFATYREQDIRILEQMKQITCSQNEVFQIIGLLTSLRVAHDSDNKQLSQNVKCYPLTQAQISQFTEEYLERSLRQSDITLWDIYNIATEIYKPGRTEIPNLIPQNVSMIEVLKSRYNLGMAEYAEVVE